ncbi:DUF805 domain-containing protein [Citromicrobium bathyomarinum]|uniref:DUF805 domain-containing protein n=1 Tax=Citromicrobium bathyomarinum TaxID=72174 RepID=UPI00315B0051
MAYQTPLRKIPGDLARTVLGTFRFAGRSSRTEAWTYILIAGWLSYPLAGLLEVLIGEATTFGEPSVSRTIATLAFCAPIPALIARRCHDIGWSGWFALIVPITFVVCAFSENAQPEIVGIEKMDFGWMGLTVSLLLILSFYAALLVPPVIGPNKYGADPRPDETPDDTLPTNS